MSIMDDPDYSTWAAEATLAEEIETDSKEDLANEQDARRG